MAQYRVRYFILVMSVFFGAPAWAATYCVGSSSDPATANAGNCSAGVCAGANSCTLRDALTKISGQNESDSISFDPSVTLITLVADLPDVSSVYAKSVSGNVTVSGPQTTISGASAYTGFAWSAPGRIASLHLRDFVDAHAPLTTHGPNTEVTGNLFDNNTASVVQQTGTIDVHDNVFCWSAAVALTLKGMATVTNNRFGISKDGTACSFANIAVAATIGSSVQIGEAGFGNLISATIYGVLVNGQAVIQANRLGVSDNGDVTPSWSGILVQGSGPVQVGGDAPGEGNLVGGATVAGIDCNSPSGIVAGNLVGWDGSANKANAVGIRDKAGCIIRHNVVRGNGTGLEIQGAASIVANVIAGNSGWGILVDSPSPYALSLTGNFVGVDSDGVTARGNGSDGVRFRTDSTGTVIGGPAVADANIIAFNTGRGVVSEAGVAAIGLSGNRIFANSQSAIDWHEDGPSANDSPDSDGLPNKPTLTSIVDGVRLDLSAKPIHAYAITVFGQSACTGEGQAEMILQQTILTTDANGAASENIKGLAASFYTATASESDTLTSELAACAAALPGFGVFSFAKSEQSASEGTPSVSVQVVRQGSVASSVTVTLSTSGDLAPARFQLPTALDFAAGEVEKTLTVMLSDDQIVEPTQTLVVTLSGDVQLGASPTWTLTLNDNDATVTAPTKGAPNSGAPAQPTAAAKKKGCSETQPTSLACICAFLIARSLRLRSKRSSPRCPRSTVNPS